MTQLQIISLVFALIGSSGLAALVTLWVNKKTRQAEVKRTEAEVAEVISKTYAGLVKSLNDELSRTRKINDDLEKCKRDLESEVSSLRGEKESLLTQIHLLQNEVASLRKLVGNLSDKLKNQEK